MKRRMFVTAAIALLGFMLPAGAVVGQDLPPGPTLVYRTSMEVTSPPAAFETINLVLDFAPGAWTPFHSHGGQGIVTVLDGELIHRPEGGAERRLVAGESFLEIPGHPHVAGNASSANTRVLFTILLPPGTELTTVQGAPQPATPPSLPGTGEAPLPVTLPDTGSERGHLVLLMLTTVLVLGGAAMARGNRVRR